MSATGEQRCRHELLPGQCADCPRPTSKKRAVANPLTGAVAAAQVERLVTALLAQQRGAGKTKAVRSRLARKVTEAESPLSKADRRRARQIAMERQPAFRPTRAQLAHEDRIAGVFQPWITSQNVGRGKRS